MLNLIERHMSACDLFGSSLSSHLSFSTTCGDKLVICHKLKQTTKAMVSEKEAKAETTPADQEKEKEPEACRCVVLTGIGGLNKVQVQQRPKPKPVDGHVLVKVHSCGLNFADLMQCQGLYYALATPYVMGIECSGVVEEVGPGVTEFQVGTRVIAYSMTFGMMSEFVSVPIVQVFAIPDSMTFDDAAALSVNYVTAYQILFDIGNLKEDESVLVHMAAGGVGVAATQLCKTVPNVTVFGTASKSKHDKITAHGVSHAIDYRNNDYAEEVLKIQPDGVDIVMDPLGGKDTTKGYDLLKPLGKIICYGASNIVKGESKSIFNLIKQWYHSVTFSPLKLMGDNKTVSGYNAGEIGKTNPEMLVKPMRELITLYEEGKIKPEIYAVLSFEEVTDAMQCMHDRKNIGKLILSPLKEPLKPELKEEKNKEKETETKEEQTKDKGKDATKDGEKETVEISGEEEGKPEENA